MQKIYIVYKVTNEVNGKMYIGKTYDLETRRKQHINKINDNLPFHKSLLKYGLNNFKWEIIDYANNNEDILKKEIYWIKKLNTCINSLNSKGYNITIGGEGGVSWNSKPITQFDKKGNYIDEYESASCASFLNNIARKYIEKCCKGIGYTAGGFLWKYSKDCNGLNIEPYIKPSSSRNKAIIQLDCNGNFISEYKSLTEASDKTSTIRTSISGCLSKNYATANNFQWIYKEDYNVDFDYRKKDIIRGNEILQLDLKGNIVGRFNNCIDASKKLGISSYKIIHKALDNDKKTSCGFKWMRNNTYINLKKENTEVTD